LKTRIFIGTSGWHYKHWLEGVVYPPGTKGAQMFEYYARHFLSGSVLGASPSRRMDESCTRRMACRMMWPLLIRWRTRSLRL